MSGTSTTFEWIANQLNELLGTDPSEIQRDSRLIDDLGADSIDIVELATAAERDFGISVEEEQIYEIATVADAVRLIDGLKSA